MKNNNIFKQLSHMLNIMLMFNLSFGPYAHAQTDDTEVSSPPSQNRERGWRNAMDIANILGETTLGVLNALNPRQAGGPGDSCQLMNPATEGPALKAQLAQMSPKPHRDNLLPQCMVLPAKTDMMSGICEGPMSSPSDCFKTSQYLMLAKQNANLYENQATQGNLDGKATGLQCLNEQKTLLSQKLADRLKNIDLMLDKVNKANEDFKAMAQKDLDQIKDIQSDLTGGQDSKNSTAQTRDFSNLFTDSACKAAINSSTVKNLSESDGLIGIREKLEENQADAENLLRSEQSIKSEIQNAAEKMNQSIRSRNFDDLLDPQSLRQTAGSDFNNYQGSFNAIVEDSFRSVANKYSELENTKSQLGDSLENILDENTDIDQAVERWERNYYNGCMNEKMGIDIGTFVSKIRDPNVSDSSSNNANFRTNVTRTLTDSDLDLDEKIQEISRLENTSIGSNQTFEPGSIIIPGGSMSDNWKVSDYLKVVDNTCEQEFNNEENSAGLTNQQIKQRAYGIRQEYDTLRQNLASDMQIKLTSRLIDCVDVPYNASSGTSNDSCSSDKIDRSSENFCLKQSLSCARSMNSCYDKAEQIVKEKQEQRRQIANRYNAQVQQYKIQQRALLEDLKGQFLQQAQELRQYYPGGDFDIPTELQITVDGIPDEPNPKYGEALENPEDFTKDLVDHLETLKEETIKQNKNIEGVIDNKIATVETNLNAEATKWSKLADTKCTNKLNNYQERLSREQDEMANQRDEAQEQLNEYCAIRNRMRHVAGCDQVESLYSAAMEASQHLQPGDQASITEFERVCHSYNNHTEDDEQTYSADDFEDYCTAVGDDSDSCNYYENVESCDDQLSEKLIDPDYRFTHLNISTMCRGLTEEHLNLIIDLNQASIDAEEPASPESIEEIRSEIFSASEAAVVQEMRDNGALRTPGNSRDIAQEANQQLQEIGQRSSSSTACTAQNSGSGNPFTGLLEELGNLNQGTDASTFTQ